MSTPSSTSINTPIGPLSLYTLGTGPSLLIIHGSASTAETHLALARLLSPYYTVHLYSRRARGLSAPYPSSITSIPAASTPTDPPITNGDRTLRRTYNPAFAAALLETDVSDLDIVVKKTGAKYMIAVSTGALVVLHYLLTVYITRYTRTVKKAVLFEPPIFFADRSEPVFPKLLPRFEEEWKAGDAANAMITAMKVVQLGPWWIPRWIARGVLWLVGKKGEEKMGETLRYDFAVVEGMVGSIERFKAVHDIEILLLGGEKSPEYLKRGLECLDEVLGRRVVLEGVGHEVLCGEEMRGRPKRALEVLRELFG